ncbi:MAG: hypothetical protein ABEH88_01415 [Halobacteriales archaeon]
MRDAVDRRTVLIVGLVLGAIVGLSGIGTAHSDTSLQPVDVADVTEATEIRDRPPAQSDPPVAELAEQEEGDTVGCDSMEIFATPGWRIPPRTYSRQYEEDGGETENGGASLLGDWWGLGGEAQETPYIGLVELGVLVLTLGLGGYMIGKRSSLVPAQYRRYLLPAHEWSMLAGTALTAPHFFAVEEWEGLGFAVGVLLAIEVASGLYGRHLHRDVIRLSRRNETPPVLGYLLDVSKGVVFSRWRWIHRSLTVVTAAVLVLHIVTAIGE